jgi:hypothetical protein
MGTFSYSRQYYSIFVKDAFDFHRKKDTPLNIRVSPSYTPVPARKQATKAESSPLDRGWRLSPLASMLARGREEQRFRRPRAEGSND